MTEAGSTGNVPKIGGKNAILAGEILFAHTVLGNMQGRGAGADWTALCQMRHGLGWHIFEFSGDHVNASGKLIKRWVIIIGSRCDI